ncbi:MAG TPA: LutB/LldF family L-lactate oxidation iron-sulfur protein [Verrucomicrobiae bacterium]|nr:LutB/LldF family L-lactate oxidation iron-sulfur protein [Verrucomicrobiae bacterium]
MNSAARSFLWNAAVKSADLSHREIIRHAIDSYDLATRAGRKQYVNWQAARQRAYEIKWEGVNHLDRYLLQFEAKVQERGGHVFWAENGEEAREYVVRLALRSGVHTIVKSKSMVSEEIHLSSALESQGIRVFETDLGEFIVQLRNEPPYHIVTPAMHLTRKQIAALFREKFGIEETEDSEVLVAAARKALRHAFFGAEMGITGANFLVADTGMLAITTNEGNADLGMSLPRIHVAIAGIEKIVPKMEDLAVLWPVLATAGTGQRITCYNTLVGGPRRPGEKIGPEEFHVVLLDNGRSELLGDAEMRDVLQCIRCGACLNACPVYRTIGGHTYATTYQGPIGSVLTPRLRGMNEFQHLSFASSLCGACTEACPVKIDLHHHLLHNRRNAVSSARRPFAERAAFRVWSWAMESPRRASFFGALGRWASRVVYSLGISGTRFDPLGAWTEYHAPPAIPGKSFRTLWREEHGNR